MITPELPQSVERMDALLGNPQSTECSNQPPSPRDCLPFNHELKKQEQDPKKSAISLLDSQGKSKESTPVDSLEVRPAEPQNTPERATSAPSEAFLIYIFTSGQVPRPPEIPPDIEEQESLMDDSDPRIQRIQNEPMASGYEESRPLPLHGNAAEPRPQEGFPKSLIPTPVPSKSQSPLPPEMLPSDATEPSPIPPPKLVTAHDAMTPVELESLATHLRGEEGNHPLSLSGEAPRKEIAYSTALRPACEASSRSVTPSVLSPRAHPRLHGTARAEYREQMKESLPWNKNAESAVQTMPGSETAMLWEEKVTSWQERSSSSETTLAKTGVESMENSPASFEPLELTENPEECQVSDTDFKTHLLGSIRDEAVLMRECKFNRLSVVLKPVDGLELSLHLVQRSGHIEAQAVFHQGDFEKLNSQWGQIQSALSLQGVRLGDLEYSVTASIHRSESSNLDLSGDTSRREQPNFAAESSFETDFNSRTHPPLTARNQNERVPTTLLPDRGWESWA